jgi:hypothetical protein
MAKVDSKGKVTVERGDTPAKIAKDLGISVAQVNAAIKANPTLAARQSSGKTVLFSGTTFKVPGVGATSTTGGTPGVRTETGRVTNADGSVTITYSDGTSETLGGGGGNRTLPDPYAEQRDFERKSAFSILEDTFKQYNLETLAPVIKQFMIEGISAEEATLRLRDTDVYKNRFIGNQGRIAKGLAAYSPKEYLQAEEVYQNLLNSNNLSGLANKTTVDKLIAGAVSPAETQDRINKVFNKIDNASAEVKNELGRYFSQYGFNDPNMQRNQLAESILSGEDPAMKLESGIRKAQLRAGATAAKFTLPEQRVETIESLLQQAGISDTYAAGQQGFQTLAKIEPQAQALSERYQMEAATQEELQKEAFLGLKSERRKKSEEAEKAAFKGSAGTTQVSLGQQSKGNF